jgi:hypothetical protein
MGLLLIIAALATGGSYPVLASIYFLAIGIALWRSPSHQDIVLDESGIDFQNYGCKLSYDEITWLSMGDRFIAANDTEAPLGPIRIGFEGGHYPLSDPVNESPREFVRFLLERMPAPQRRAVNPVLADFYQKQSAKFGEDKVHVIHARRVVSEKAQRNGSVRLGLGLIAAGLISLGAAVVMLDPTDEFSGFWLAGSVVAIMVGIISCIVGGNAGRRQKSQSTLRDACVVISPSGLAMIQGSLRGILRWEEIVKVAPGPVGSFGNRDAALHLSVAGGNIIVLDVYEVPLTNIAALIRKNLGVKA